MKQNILFILSLSFLMFACEQSEQINPLDVEGHEPENLGSMIDPATDPKVQPFIAGEDLKSSPTEEWDLVFSDEFNSFDDSKWLKSNSTRSRSPRWNKGIHEWYYKPENVDVSSGKLRLKATKPSTNKMYCGSVESRGKYEPLYGYMEARMQIADINSAVHTAFWMQGSNQGNVDGSGADGSEVDIFESPFSRERAQTVLHWDGYGADKDQKTKEWLAPGIHSGYHTYGVKWTPDYMEFYYDGVKKWTYTGVGIPKVKEWLWLSVGASFGDGDFKNGTYPTYAYVDYVRVYQLPESKYIECESHSRNSPTNDALKVKNNKAASKGKYVAFSANAKNDRIRFSDITVSGSGYYKVTVTGLTWKSFGRYKCSIWTGTKWHYFTHKLDLYKNNTTLKNITYGPVYLNSGNCHVVFTVDGKNSKSTGFGGAFDKIVLKPEL